MENHVPYRYLSYSDHKDRRTAAPEHAYSDRISQKPGQASIRADVQQVLPVAE
jgi:hypothetical protein